MSKFMELLGLFVLSIGMSLYRLFIFTKVWGYIAVKIFNLPQISFWQSFAICSLISVLTEKASDGEKKTTEESAQRLMDLVVGLSITWLVCYLVFG